MLKPHAPISVLSALCKSSGVQCGTLGAPSAGGVGFGIVKATEATLAKVVSRRANSFSFIEPNLKVYALPEVPTAKTNETALPWGLERIGVKQRSFRGQGVHVYVLDTGIFSDHTDFGGRAMGVMDVTIREGERIECSGSDEFPCAKDGQGHGTHCAGTIAGGFYGVAPSAKVYGIKVLSDSGSGTMAGVLGGMDWVAINGLRPAVASMSLGGGGVQQSQHVAVEAMTNAGVTVVVAAGNENTNACSKSPAFSPAAFTVGASTSKDARASFSNFGACVDIWAPGEAILSLGITSDTSTATHSGTSMACPHVAGAAAVVLSSNLLQTPAEVKQMLSDTALGSVLTGLKKLDTNDLLWVGPPQPKPSTTTTAPDSCPEFAKNAAADANGDCQCPAGTACKEPVNFFGNVFYVDCKFSGGKSSTYFAQTCEECDCKRVSL